MQSVEQLVKLFHSKITAKLPVDCMQSSRMKSFMPKTGCGENIGPNSYNISLTYLSTYQNTLDSLVTELEKREEMRAQRPTKQGRLSPISKLRKVSSSLQRMRVASPQKSILKHASLGQLS